MVKLCLYLQYRSSGCCEAICSSGIITLPSGRTLRDYKHFAPAISGFTVEYDKQLIDLAKKTSVLGKYVGILVDVKEGLVFNKHSGALTSFIDLGDITTHLIDQCQEQSELLPGRQMAKTIVVLMIRELLTDLHNCIRVVYNGEKVICHLEAEFVSLRVNMKAAVLENRSANFFEDF